MDQNSYGLQQYLTTIQKKEELPSKRQARASTSILKNKKTSTNTQKEVPPFIGNYQMNYCAILGELQQQHKEVASLDTESFKILQHIHSIFLGKSVEFDTVVKDVSRATLTSKLEVEQQLFELLNKRLVIGRLHPWKGVVITSHPILYQHYSFDEVDIENPNSDGEGALLYERDWIPFEKQLIFMMNKLSELNLTVTGGIVQPKLKIDELRSACININPMLVQLESPSFLHKQDVELDIIQCDDKVVQFVLNIAYHCHWLVKHEERLLFHFPNWGNWLQLPIKDKQAVLKLVIAQVISFCIEENLKLFFLRQLFSEESIWRKERASLDNALNVVQFINSFGWSDMLQLNETLYIRMKSSVDEASKPFLLPQLQLYCLPDCLSQSIWQLLKVSHYQHVSEIIRLQVTEKSLRRALKAGYTVKSIATILELDFDSEYYPYYERLVKYVLNEDQYETKAKQQMIQNKDLKGQYVINSLATFSTMLSELTQVNETAIDYMNEKINQSLDELNSIPKLWFTALRAYNYSTNLKIVQCSIAFGLKLGMLIDGSKVYCLPIKLVENESKRYVQGIVIPINLATTPSYEQAWLVDSISKICLVR